MKRRGIAKNRSRERPRVKPCWSAPNLLERTLALQNRLLGIRRRGGGDLKVAVLDPEGGGAAFG